MKLASQHSTEVAAVKISSEDEQFTQPQSSSDETKASESPLADTEVTIAQKSPDELSSAVSISVQTSNETSTDSSNKQISTHTSSDTTTSSFNTLDTLTMIKTVSSTECGSDEETPNEHAESDNQITGCSDTHTDWNDTDATPHLSEIPSFSAAMKIQEGSGNDKNIPTLIISPEDVTHAVT